MIRKRRVSLARRRSRRTRARRRTRRVITRRRGDDHARLLEVAIGIERDGARLGGDVVAMAHGAAVCELIFGEAFHLDCADDLEPVAFVPGLAGVVAHYHCRVAGASGRGPEFCGAASLVIGGADVAGGLEEAGEEGGDERAEGWGG